MTVARPGLRTAVAVWLLMSGMPPLDAWRQAPIDLTSASIVVPAGADGASARLAASVLQDEIARRTGLHWPIVSNWPRRGPVVAIATGESGAADAMPVTRLGADGYRLATRSDDGRTVVSIVGADRRAAIFGIGGLLRAVDWRRGRVTLAAPLNRSTAPRYAIRGHQLGYRHHSNTYDGWTDAHYDQYIRELMLLGANAIENIPFQDSRVSPLMPLPRDEMTRRVSAICAKYGLDYWLWLPADFDLGDQARRAESLMAVDALVGTLPRLDAIFVPGGDPGDNAATLVVPYLADLAHRIRRRHPSAKVWLSLQHFDKGEIDFVFAWIERARPEWLGGLVAGPGSYPTVDIRRRLDPSYRLRDYPDIGHTVRSQYPVAWWDPAFNFTLGREPVNPRPAFYASVHDRVAPSTDGFITYSDGVNDDFNKGLWTLKGWDPDLSAAAVAHAYARLFFGADVAELAADGLLALERNWQGALSTNAGVAATLALWESGARRVPTLDQNWRWQLHLMRATYDAYIQRRLDFETRLERDALDVLEGAAQHGTIEAMARASDILAAVGRAPCCPTWRARIEALCDGLFATIRMQSSVIRHSASGAERGAVLDSVDHPLNNRWWLEDRFAAIRGLDDETERRARLKTIVEWSRPGGGNFYDDVGDVGNSPRVRRAGTITAAIDESIPHFAWEDGPSRQRLSTLTSLRWPMAIDYADLDPAARYVVRLHVTRHGLQPQVRLRIDGEPVGPRPAATEPMLLEFVVPPPLSSDGRLTLTFDDIDESDVNWRQYSRLADAWLIRQ